MCIIKFSPVPTTQTNIISRGQLQWILSCQKTIRKGQKEKPLLPKNLHWEQKATQNSSFQHYH
uniref:Uncharacterized protein n=1 Tax=Rhizophora mucronata TaxID=61149 RepID=A0A2P2KZH4_RHIMU